MPPSGNLAYADAEHLPAVPVVPALGLHCPPVSAACADVGRVGGIGIAKLS